MKKLFAALVFAVATSAAWAIPQVLTYNNTSNSYVGDFSVFGNIFSNGKAEFIFALPDAAANGVYHVAANFGGSGVAIDWEGTNLNGAQGTSIFSAPGIDFGFITTNTLAPFTLSLSGADIGNFHALGGHIDAYLTTPVLVAASVPEPGSLAMMLSGLGLMSVVGFRRSQK